MTRNAGWFFLLAGVFLAVPTALAAQHETPDASLAPGVENPNVTRANVATTICTAGWTGTVRPPTSYTNTLKRQQLANWGYQDKTLGNYEEDHRIPLSVGGHPSDPQNLWPQPYNIAWGARVKDKLEQYAWRGVCAGQLSLQEARAIFKGNWIEAFKERCGPEPTSSCSNR
jgi:hypothetical protein